MAKRSKKQKKGEETMNTRTMSAGAGAAGGGPMAASASVDPGLMLVALRSADNGEHAAEECAARARQIRISSLDLQDKADALAEEIRASNLAGDCAQVEIDLNAAKVKVSALSAARVAELTALAQKLDRQIVVGQLLNTSLIAVTQVLESVVKVRDILSDPGLRV